MVGKWCRKYDENFVLIFFFYKYGNLNIGKFMEMDVKYVEDRVNHIILLNNTTTSYSKKIWGE